MQEAKIIAELDSKKGIGLIEKRRQGLGKPDIIYVKNFVVVEQNTQPETMEKEPANTDVSTEVQKLNDKKFNNQTSGSSEAEFTEVQEVNPNYNNTNYTDLSYNNPIYQSDSDKKRGMDGMDEVNVYIEIIKENIEYEHHMKYGSYQDKEL